MVLLGKYRILIITRGINMLPMPRLFQYSNVVIPKINGVYANISPTSPNMAVYSQSVCYGTDNTIGYIFGGYNGSSNSNFYKYDAVQNSYTTLTNSTISARYGAGMVYYNGLVYIFGGTAASGNVADFYSYNVSTLQYSTITSTNTPSARAHNRMCAVGTKLYMYGGESSNNLFSYDPVSSVWTALANCPVTNNINGDMCTDGKYLYVVSNSSNFYRYDIAANTWTTLASRINSTAYRICYLNGYIYEYGSTVLHSYNIDNNSWANMPSGGYSVTRNGLLGLNNSIISFGGVGSSSTSSVWKIT